MYRYRRTDPRQVMAAGALGFAVTASLGARAAAAGHHHHDHHAVVTAARGEPKAAARAIRFARARLGCPYVWGGTGPCSSGYDCSGLVQQAYASAGVTIPRTAAEQWAALPHVRHLQPGDLIYYAGADGTVASPGHVVLYVGHGKVIQAYSTGYPVMVTPLSRVNAGGLTGYARPS